MVVLSSLHLGSFTPPKPQPVDHPQPKPVQHALPPTLHDPVKPPFIRKALEWRAEVNSVRCTAFLTTPFYLGSGPERWSDLAAYASPFTFAEPTAFPGKSLVSPFFFSAAP